MGHLDVMVTISADDLESGRFFNNLWDSKTETSNVFKGRSGFVMGGIYRYHFPVKDGTIILDEGAKCSSAARPGYAHLGFNNGDFPVNKPQPGRADWVHVSDLDFQRAKEEKIKKALEFYREFDLWRNRQKNYSGFFSSPAWTATRLGLAENSHEDIGDPMDPEYWNLSGIDEKTFLEEYSNYFDPIITSAALGPNWSWEEKPILANPKAEMEWYNNFASRFIDTLNPDDTIAIFDVHV